MVSAIWSVILSVELPPELPSPEPLLRRLVMEPICVSPLIEIIPERYREWPGQATHARKRCY